MSTQGVLKQGKKRKQNFTSAECALLVDLVEKNMDTLRGQFSSSITNIKKQELWKSIASRINSLGYEKRTPSEIRDKWRNLSQIAKKINTGIMQSQRKTGGGPPAKPPSATTEKIINLLSDEPSFSGIQGGLESAGVSSCSGRLIKSAIVHLAIALKKLLTYCSLSNSVCLQNSVKRFVYSYRKY